MGLVGVLYQIIWWILEVIWWVVIVWVIISWIVFFAGQTSFRWRNRTAFSILTQLNDIFGRMAYPFLKPFRRLLPPHKMAGIDWSPMLLLLAIFIIRALLGYVVGLILFRG
jgi:YggT family protein